MHYEIHVKTLRHDYCILLTWEKIYNANISTKYHFVWIIGYPSSLQFYVHLDITQLTFDLHIWTLPEKKQTNTNKILSMKVTGYCQIYILDLGIFGIVSFTISILKRWLMCNFTQSIFINGYLLPLKLHNLPCYTSVTIYICYKMALISHSVIPQLLSNKSWN